MQNEPPSSETSIRIRITGRVQGVGFRQGARQEARRLGLPVSAINQDDGSVLVETSGPRPAVEQFVEWTRRGPELARVDDVIVTPMQLPAQEIS